MSKISEKWQGLRTLFKFDNTLQLIINRLFFSKTGSSIYILNGLEILVDHSAGEHNGTRSCLVPGLYDPCFEMMSDLPKSISVLDLGANGGGFLIALQNAGWQIEQAVAVELNPFTHSRLLLNLIRNIPKCHKKVKVINGAAESSDGILTVTLSYGSVGDSVVTPPSDGEIFEISSYSLATLCSYFPKEQCIDVCKIDIEGSEYRLFASMPPEQLARFKHIIIEIHESDKFHPDQLINRIMDAGFHKVAHRRPLPENTVHHFIRASNPSIS